MKTKLCVGCNISYSLNFYTKHSGNKDKLSKYCRFCRTQQMRNYIRTGSTVTNEFEGKSVASLKTIFSSLKAAYELKGYKLTLEKE